MKKEFAYLLKMDERSKSVFETFESKLGWNKKTTILKLMHIFEDFASELSTGKELVIQVRDEKSKQVVKEKVASFDLLWTPI